jgi:hypothetical protein
MAMREISASAWNRIKTLRTASPQPNRHSSIRLSRGRSIASSKLRSPKSAILSLSPGKESRIFFGERLSRKSCNVVVFPLVSTSQYSNRWNHCGLACCYAIMNHLNRPMFCASCCYWCRCFRHQGNLYRSSLLLGLFLASSLLLDLTGLGGLARSLSSRRHRSRDHGEY